MSDTIKRALAVCCIMFTLVRAAHPQDRKINYGVAVGATHPVYVLSNISSGVSRSASSTYNGQLSSWVSWSPTPYAGLEAGASVVGLGAKLTQSEFGSRNVIQHTYWLQFPVNIIGKLPLRDSSNFFVKAGGYVGVGLFGSNNVPNDYTGSATQDFSFGERETQQPVDIGWTLNMGYKLKSGYLISVGYQQGISDIAPSQAAYEQRNRAYTLSIGYEF